MLNRSLSPTALSYSNLSLASLHFANNGGSTNVQTGIMPSATDEVLRLRKDVSLPTLFIPFLNFLSQSVSNFCTV